MSSDHSHIIIEINDKMVCRDCPAEFTVIDIKELEKIKKKYDDLVSAIKITYFKLNNCWFGDWWIDEGKAIYDQLMKEV